MMLYHLINVGFCGQASGEYVDSLKAEYKGWFSRPKVIDGSPLEASPELNLETNKQVAATLMSLQRGV